MNSPDSVFVPGQRTVFHTDGAVMQRGDFWYVLRNGVWEVMRPEEIAQQQAKQ